MKRIAGRVASVSITAAVLIGLIAASASADAWYPNAQGNVGQHWPADVDCNYPNQMMVHSPMIWSSTVSYPPNVVAVGTNHLQWVAYRSWLVKDGAYTGAHSPWFKAQVGHDNNTLQPSSWLNLDTGYWVSGYWNFQINYRGNYKVVTEYYWYPDEMTGYGYDWLVDQSYYVSVSSFSERAYASCQF